ncbi:kynurenine formamidase [Bacillus coahuilensis m2-6]|uniref:arylformamidase n=1 Tax=Bacillus coahuilensis TaxID=408580 RepID=UPI000750503A|nr:arylformamidase [Bacillus coahuilensis]KUP09516.1 kynurenine formamidase [Bacillus coahuilensis m2-6]
MEKGRWKDISQVLQNDIPHWPNDTPFTYETRFTKEQTGSVNVGRITSSLHTGTHIDAPYHFTNDGERVLDLDINLFIGPAKVIDVSLFNCLDVELLRSFQLERGTKRVLLKTTSEDAPTTFPKQIPLIKPEVAPYLAGLGVILLGVDLPSVDPLTSKELLTHHELNKNGIHILEGLVFADVVPGDYELIALPLPIQDGDGSPVRAVIRPLGKGDEENE